MNDFFLNLKLKFVVMKTMKKTQTHIMFILSIFILASCKVTNVNEFKQKYDWDITECYCKEIGYKAINIEFEYNGTTYTAYSGLSLDFLYYRYKLLIDKNDPEHHFIVLLDQPIPPADKEMFHTNGKIVKVTTCENWAWVVCETTMETQFLHLWNNATNSNQGGRVRECFSLENYTDMVKLMDSKADIVVDYCYVYDPLLKKDRIQPYINREELKKKFE